MVELSEAQKANIKKYVADFKEFLKSETGQEWQRDREERISLFHKLFSVEHFDDLTEDELKNVIKVLWASQMWGNKEYLANKIIEDNGFDRLREELKELIYGSDSLDKRYDRFRRNIKGLAGASITEILGFVAPNEYCIWNKTPINVLPFLKMQNLLSHQTHPSFIRGSHYVKLKEVLQLIRCELAANKLEDPDFIDTDHFLYYLLVYKMPEEQVVTGKEIEEKIEIEEELKEISTHEEAEAVLLELGRMMGFETYTTDSSKEWKGKRLGEISTLSDVPRGLLAEDILDVIKRIDVIWFKGEMPKYCFEVEQTTSITEGLLRLYQISLLTDIRFFIVAPSEASARFERETIRRPFREIRERYIFKPYGELAALFNSANRFYPLLTKFGIG